MKDNSMNIQSSEHILLTGAGFTKNMGAPLASEMWALIFNHKRIQAHPKIKELMTDDFDYESIYNSIMEDSDIEDEKEDEKEAINDAVKFAYENIDAILREYASRTSHPPEIFNILKFIWQFAKKSGISFIFTLNQDLFFERVYYGDKPFIPGIENNSEWFTSTFRNSLSLSDYCQLPNEEELNLIKTDILSDRNFFLIKLHGSYNWKSFDGTQKMVIGSDKTDQIQKEPLLEYYFEIFKNALSQHQRRLLIIGYGFGDDHINRIISDAVSDRELKIYIISPVSPEDFKNKLFEETEYGKNIWQGISGYFPYNLKEIFPKNLTMTQAGRNLYESFLGGGLIKI